MSARVRPAKTLSRADNDRYVAALEAKLRDLGVKDEAIAELRKTAETSESAKVEDVKPRFQETLEARIKAVKDAGQDVEFTLPIEVRLRHVHFSAKAEVGKKPELRTVANANPLGKIATRLRRAAGPAPELRDKHMLHDVSASFRSASRARNATSPSSRIARSSGRGRGDAAGARRGYSEGERVERTKIGGL